jgi:hypothetical protein
MPASAWSSERSPRAPATGIAPVSRSRSGRQPRDHGFGQRHPAGSALCELPVGRRLLSERSAAGEAKYDSARREQGKAPCGGKPDPPVVTTELLRESISRADVVNRMPR